MIKQSTVATAMLLGIFAAGVVAWTATRQSNEDADCATLAKLWQDAKEGHKPNGRSTAKSLELYSDQCGYQPTEKDRQIVIQLD